MKVSIKQLEFPSSIKDKVLKLKDISKLHIDFIGGKYIHFENTNLSIHEPHQIVISNDSNYFVIINYENNPTLYDKSTMQNITMESIKFLISVYLPLIMWYYGIVVKIDLIFIHKGNSLVFFRAKNMKGEWNEKRKNCCWFISSCFN